ncbi:MAG: hypothetical protein VZR33_09425 [Methanosphaera sp.]|nr:hypothetical protein [Methanosphaera sp.]
MQKEIPSYVKWNNDAIVKHVFEKMFNDYYEGEEIFLHYYDNVEDFFNQAADESHVLGMNYTRVRYAITFLGNYGYDHEFYDAHECNKFYKQAHLAEGNFNKWFDINLPDGILELYNYYDSHYNTEKWGGEQRYLLLNKTTLKPNIEMACLKAAVRFKHFINAIPKIECNIENAVLLSKLLDIPYWEFGHRKDQFKYDIFKSEKDFMILNRMQIRELKAQDEFIDAVISEHNVDKAYDILPDSDIIE